MSDLEPFDASAVVASGLVQQWARGAARQPFERPQDLGAFHDVRWSRDCTRLWMQTRRGWIQWDARTGARLRRASRPDDVDPPLLDPDLRQAHERWTGGTRTREVIAFASDLSRLVVVPVDPQGRRVKHAILCDAQGLDITVLEGLVVEAPVAFSSDGNQLVGCQFSALVVYAARDGKLIRHVQTRSLQYASHMVRARDGAVIVALRRPDARLLCYHTGEQRLLWELPIWARELQTSRSGEHIALRTVDHQVRVLDVETGAAIIVPDPQGPVLNGEPDTADLLARLAAHPIRIGQASIRIRGVRAFADGTRMEVSVKRLVQGSYRDEIFTIDTVTGAAVTDEPPPWRPSPERIAHAVAGLTLDTNALRAVSTDGRLMFFLLGRNEYSYADPDAGQLTTYDVTCALWDDGERTWRWETSSSLADLGVNTWLLEQAAFDFTFDQSGITGRGGGHISSQAHDVADGALRPLRPTDQVPRPAGLHEGEVLAADPACTFVVVARDTRVELWDVAGDRVVASVDLAPLDDAATTAAIVSSTGAFVIGTELGRLLRFAPALVHAS